ncbi:hypothetical protein V8F33_008809 [Rhypophila sp. PSN 637]
MASAKFTTRENKSPMDNAIWELRQCHRAIGARLAKMQKKRAEQQAPTQQQEVEETILDVDLAILALSVCMLRLETGKQELRASFPEASLKGEEQQRQRTWMQRGSPSWVPHEHDGWQEQVDARRRFDEQRQQQQQQHGDSDSSSGWDIIKPRKTKPCRRKVRSLVLAESEIAFNKLWEECSKDDSQNKPSPVKIQKQMEFDKLWEEQCSAPARVDEVKAREEPSPIGKTSQQQETTSQTTRPSVTTTTISAFLSASDSLEDDKKNSLSLRDIDVLYYKERGSALDRGSRSTSSLMAITDMVNMGPVAHPLAREIATRRASAPPPPPENSQDAQGEGGYSTGSFWGKIVGSFRKVFTKSSSTDTSGAITRNIVVAQKVNEPRFETLGNHNLG